MRAAGRALAIYQDLRRRLRAELGIEPSNCHRPAATRGFSGRTRAWTTADRAAGPSPLTRRSGRPAGRPPVSPLIGRVAELTGLHDALAAGRRLITLVGPGGVGKSRLLVELGKRYRGPKELVYTAMSGRSQVDPDELAEAIGVGRTAVHAEGRGLAGCALACARRQQLATADRRGGVGHRSRWYRSWPAILDELPGRPDRHDLTNSARRGRRNPGPIEPLACPAKNADIRDHPREPPAVKFLMQRLADRAVPVDASNRRPLPCWPRSPVGWTVSRWPLNSRPARQQVEAWPTSPCSSESLLDVPAAEQSTQHSVIDRCGTRSSGASADWPRVIERCCADSACSSGSFDLASRRCRVRIRSTMSNRSCGHWLEKR